MSLLNTFIQFSGHKLNLHKVKLFPINHQASQLRLNVPFKIARNNFTYLGVNVTRSYNQLFKANFAKLLEQTKQYRFFAPPPPAETKS